MKITGISNRRKSIALSLLVILVVAALSSAPAAATLHGLQVGMEGPPISLRTLKGEAIRFDDLKGEKLTLLLFWSTWSNKSEKALVQVQKLYQTYQNKGLAVVGVNADGLQTTDATLHEIQALREKLHITFPLVVDPALEAFHEYGVIAVPTTVVLDRERRIGFELSGFPTVAAETIVEFVATTIDGSKPSVAVGKAAFQPNKSAIRCYNMGQVTLKSKRMAETAEMWFKKAIDADDRFLLPRLSLGQMYVQRGDALRAKEEFNAVLAREPANPVALCESGMILFDEGKAAEGKALISMARKAEAAYSPCYYYAGYISGKEGDLAEASKMFAEAEKLNPFDYRNFVMQAKIRELQKDQKQASEAYRKALGLILKLD